MERLNMSKTSKAEYKAELDQAMEEQENWGEDVDLEDLSEAEQLAHLAEKPIRRKDGEHRGSDVRRPKPLSPRQALFTTGVIQGKSLRQAYRDAYGNDTGSDASISASANKLMKDPRIKHILEEAWEETAEHLSEDLSASKRYVLKGLLALSKKAKQEGTKLKALELMGKACGLFTPTDVQDKAVVTADQLKRELAGHIKLLEQGKASVLDVDAKRLHATPMPVAGAQEQGV
jgi:hypothetical protein